MLHGGYRGLQRRLGEGWGARCRGVLCRWESSKCGVLRREGQDSPLRQRGARGREHLDLRRGEGRGVLGIGRATPGESSEEEVPGAPLQEGHDLLELPGTRGVLGLLPAGPLLLAGCLEPQGLLHSCLG